MQSTNVNKHNPLINIVNQVVDECRVTATATVINTDNEVVTIEGEFDELIFSENPCNPFAKQLAFEFGGNTVIFNKAVLVDASTITVPANSNLFLAVDDIVNIKEVDPFLFKGTLKAVAMLQKAQPACIMLAGTPSKTEESEFYSSQDADFSRVQFVFSDFSADFQDKLGSIGELDSGYIGQDYQIYIEKPLAAFISKFKAKLSGYVFEGEGVTTTVEVSSSSDSFVEFFGRQDNFPDTELENISGWVLDMNIKLYNQTCLR